MARRNLARQVEETKEIMSRSELSDLEADTRWQIGNRLEEILFGDEWKFDGRLLVMGDDSRQGIDRDQFRNLRMDYEVAMDTHERDEIRLLRQMIEDLTELYVYGDQNSTDPYLKTINGFVKTGKTWDIVIPSIHFYHEYKLTKDAIEITAYMLVRAEPHD